MSRQQILAPLTDAETVRQLMVHHLVLPLDAMVKVLSLVLLMGAETVVAIEDIMQDAVVIVMVKPQIRVRQTAVETALATLDIAQDVVEIATDRAQQLVQHTIVETALVIVVMEHVLL